MKLDFLKKETETIITGIDYYESMKTQDGCVNVELNISISTFDNDVLNQIKELYLKICEYQRNK